MIIPPPARAESASEDRAARGRFADVDLERLQTYKNGGSFATLCILLGQVHQGLALMLSKMIDRMKGLHRWFLVTFACLTLIIRVDATHFNGDVIIRPAGEQAPTYGASHIKQYVLFFGNYDGYADYNRARATCQAIGGDLAKIETITKRNWIDSLDETGSFFATDIWTGLTENVADSPRWAPGCQPAAPSLTSGDAWVSNKRCLRLQNNGAGSFNYDHRACTDNFDFMCETYSAVTGSECDVHPHYTVSEIPDDDCVTTTTTIKTTLSTQTTTGATTTTDATTTTAVPTTTDIPTTTEATTTTEPPTTTEATATTEATTTTETTATTETPTTTTISPTTETQTTTPISTTTEVTTAKTTQTTITTTTAMPSYCVLVANVTIQEAQVIADQISKNLTVDAKSTSAYRRKLESAEDQRPSAKTIGFVGIILIIIPIGFVILADLRIMIQSAVNIRNVYKL